MMHNIKWFDIIDSTNSEAFRQLPFSDDFTVFAAGFQTKGRGQKGTSWESDSGKNMMFSIILKDNKIESSNQFIISQVVTLGVKRYMSGLGIDSKIKWPNDIYVRDKKISGILIEHFLTGDTLSSSIAGVGINLNQESFASDAPNPISVFNLLGRKLDLKRELESVLDNIFFYYAPLLKGGSDDFLTMLEGEYHESLYRLGAYFNYQELPDGEIFEAKITGIAPNACIILEKRDGTKQRYHFKEIRYL